MSTIFNQVQSQISTGHKTSDQSFEDLEDLDIGDVPERALVAAGVVAGLVAFGIVGWMVYRSLRRRPLVQRLQDSLPDSVRKLPHEVRSRVSRGL